MRRCTTCDSYEPNPRCPACQPRIEEPEYDPNFGGYDDDDVGPDLSETDPTPTKTNQ
jgi:hypothetical protein